MKPVNIIGFYLLLVTGLLVALPIWVYNCPFEKQLMNILTYVACSGGIGGTIYCIGGFYRRLGNNQFTMNWTWWYVFRPIISAVIGVFAYFMIIGGLMSISNSPDVNYSKSVNVLLCSSILVRIFICQIYKENRFSIGYDFYQK